MPVLGAATLELNADSAKLEADLGRAVAQATAFGTAIGTVVGNAITKAAGYFANLTKHAIDNADAMDKLAPKLGLTVEQTSILAAQAALADVPVSALSTSLKSLAVNAEAAARGKGKAADAFRAMGIDVASFGGDTQALFDAVIKKLGSYDDSINKSALATRIFGGSGTEMIKLAEDFEKTRALAESLGLTLDKETTAAAGRFKDNMKAAELASGAMGTRIAAALLPTLEKLSGFLVSSAQNTERLDTVTRVADTGLKLFATAGVAVAAVFDTLGGVIGAVARGLTYAAQGEYRNAFRAVREGGFDMAEKVGTAIKSVGAIWDETGNKVQAAAPATSDKIAAPALQAAEKVGKNLEQMTAKLQSEADKQSRIYEQLATGKISFIEDDPNNKIALSSEQIQNWRFEVVEAKNAANAFGSTFNSQLEDVVFNSAKASDAVAALGRSIARIMFQKQIGEPLAAGAGGLFNNMFSGMFGGSNAGGPTSAVGMTGGTFAAGGRPPLGKVSLVGERGPELFVPDTAGSIIPNSELGGGITFNNVYNVANPTDEATLRRMVAVSEKRSVAKMREIQNR